jgi:hypothetical protein
MPRPHVRKLGIYRHFSPPSPRRDIGVLYVLSNRDRSLAKVGLTRLGSPGGRAADYGRAHGIEWRTFWSAPTQRVGEVEARCHRALAPHRFANAPGCREVFHVTPETARAIALREVIAPGSIPWRLRIPLPAPMVPWGTALATGLRWAVGVALFLAAVALAQS